MFDILVEEIEKGLKKVADFLEVTPPKEEPHHSEPFNAPKGDISQVMTSRQPRHLYGEFERHERTADEKKYLNRIESPLRVSRESPVMAYRYGIWGEKIYEP